MKRIVVIAVALSAGLAACATYGGQTVSSAKSGQSELVGLRRITATQYRHAVDDVFGAGLKIAGRFEPEVRREGLFAIGAGAATISPAGLDQYYVMGADLAEQVLSKDRRAKTMPCTPAAETAADDVCTRQLTEKYGRLLFRRKLTDREIDQRVALAREVAEKNKNFYAGAQEVLTSLLSAPDFFFRVERRLGQAEALDAYSRASRLSYMLWDTTPDEALLAAAEDGSLLTEAGLSAQVERMIASPRLRDGLVAFFDDMLQLQLFETQTKDPSLFPKYNQQVAQAAREQTLRTVLNVVYDKKADYRDIFTTRETFMSRPLAIVYKVPYGAKDAWKPYTWPEPSGRAGVLTQISFLSLFSHPGRSSPTKRGVALNEIFLCQTTPMPPNDVDFSVVNDTSSATLKTVRARLLAHANDETCAGCHNLVDPPGLALERFDGLGQRRDTENGELIDVTAEIDGVKFDGAPGLGALLHDDPRPSECLVRNLYSNLTGRAVEDLAEEAKLTGLTKEFAAGGHIVPAFLKRLAMSPALYSAPKTHNASGAKS